MLTFAILQNPGHNRVYFKASRAMSSSELDHAGKKMDALPVNVREEILGGIPYLLFDSDTELTEKDIDILSRLSFVYGIFKLTESDLLPECALIPIKKNPRYYFDSDDITTILKYNGKTNELFTRLMLNVAISQTPFLDKPLTILDPMCGKGTTIFEGLLNGHNVCGVDIESKIINEAYTFLKKYLETARFKHSTHQERQGMQNYTAVRNHVRLSRSKTDDPIEAELISGDTLDVRHFYRKNTFHLIVGDLPYGVQHGSSGGKKTKSRNALPMVEQALPGWHRVLKPGGALALAWNLFLIKRNEIEDVLESGGFTLAMPRGDTSFVHRVDSAINRDLIVGVKL